MLALWKTANAHNTDRPSSLAWRIRKARQGSTSTTLAPRSAAKTSHQHSASTDQGVPGSHPGRQGPELVVPGARPPDGEQAHRREAALGQPPGPSSHPGRPRGLTATRASGARRPAHASGAQRGRGGGGGRGGGAWRWLGGASTLLRQAWSQCQYFTLCWAAGLGAG